MSGPLDGVLVADFSRVLAGPWCTMTLADLGADVVKVERPGQGDDTRAWGPPWSKYGATYFESVNRGKRSVTLDLTDPGDLAVARELACRADVLVENFKPGTMGRLGLGYDELAGVNPGLVYASISGFGTGAGADLLGYDFLVQAVGGLMSITGQAEGEPQKVGVALVDVMTGKDAAIGILAALAARERSGRGDYLEVTLLTSLLGSLVNQAQAYLETRRVPHRMGNEHPSIAPYETLHCRDGVLAIACGNDAQFARLAGVLGTPELATDPRFASNAARVAHRPALAEALEEVLRTADAVAWEESLASVQVPAGRVGTIADGLALAERLGLEPTVASLPGRTATVRHPVRWTRNQLPTPLPPPALGEHSEAIRRWLADPTEPAARHTPSWSDSPAHSTPSTTETTEVTP